MRPLVVAALLLLLLALLVAGRDAREGQVGVGSAGRSAWGVAANQVDDDDDDEDDDDDDDSVDSEDSEDSADSQDSQDSHDSRDSTSTTSTVNAAEETFPDDDEETYPPAEKEANDVGYALWTTRMPLPSTPERRAARWMMMEMLSAAAGPVEAHFAYWAAKNGALARGDLVSWPVMTEHGRSVVAKRFVPADTPVFIVPAKITMTSFALPPDLQADVVDPFLAATDDWIRSSMYAEDHDQIALTIYIAVERKRGRESFWYPYFATLPESFDGPITAWTETDLKELQDDKAINTARDVAKHNAEWYARFHEFAKNHRLAEEYVSITLADMTWAAAVLRTRAFSFPDIPDKPNAVGLIPLLDLLSHRPRPDGWVSHIGITESSCRPAATRAGAELFNDYGHSSTFETLLYYEWAERHNVDDSFTVPDDDHNRLTLSWKPTLVQASDALFHAEQEAARLGQSSPHDSSLSIDVATFLPVTWRSAKRCSLRMQELLTAWPTTLKQDVDLLASSVISERMRLAIHFRLGRKKLLAAHVKLCEDFRQWLACVPPRLLLWRSGTFHFSFAVKAYRLARKHLDPGPAAFEVFE